MRSIRDKRPSRKKVGTPMHEIAEKTMRAGVRTAKATTPPKPQAAPDHHAPHGKGKHATAQKRMAVLHRPA